ncbi:mitochondrial import inner membrane translocase subunit Tim13-like [Adelges cooleyi]|uniref:mitochondrial import inner membrane translocase subunit Tim13-like n=1 Tax=Adelges cooleyi TaxID=133065 RepID=UPI00217FAD88|nr:mitochondrial import inner membrane translocase subunit Tim13-like [Adelges cooleyi]XP_050440582.1 mitochondrial import inner membrane translocase subunit Tim13-like [Adelges cooleyi]XP_050440583.1 mitochondrial import inner membrane translocase subunit Tim13-like [Adelges cooleyi]
MDGSKLSQEELVDKLKQQVAMENIELLLTKMSRLCFNKCVTKPANSLDSSEQKCVTMCMDRYMETVSLVSKSFGERIMSESQNMH